MSARPIATFDSEYGNASFIKQTAGVEADLLLRLRSNLCLWGAPPPYSGKGRPKVHGQKFKLADKSTWEEPTATLQIEDPKWGTVQIQYWTELHLGAAALTPLQVLRITLTGKQGSKRSLKPLWLGWLGNEMPGLEQTWRCYLRRFAVDHWNRFALAKLALDNPSVQYNCTSKTLERPHAIAQERSYGWLVRSLRITLSPGRSNRPI